MQCTWNGRERCKVEAVHTEYDKQQKPWAYLCAEHRDALEAAAEAMRAGNFKPMLSAWVKAQGGAEAAAKRA